MKNFKAVRKFGAGAALLAGMSQAHAVVPTGVTDAITAMSADAVTVATSVLVAIIGVVAIKFIRKGL